MAKCESRDLPHVEISHLIDQYAPFSHYSAGGRKTLDEPAAVILRYGTGGGNYPDTCVRRGAHEAAKPLLQAQPGVGEHVLAERVATTLLDRLAVRGGDRLAGNAKRKLGDQQRSQGVARDVHALP